MTRVETMDPQEEIRRYKILLEAARRIGSVMDLNGLLDEILDRAQAVILARTCSILLPDPATDDLILLSTADEIRSLKAAPRVPCGKGVAGEVYRTKQIVNLKDATKDPRHYDRIDIQVGITTRAMLTIPLLDGEKCLGVMQALNPIDRDYFADQCVEMFTAFGVVIVSALLRLEAQEAEVDRARTRRELKLAREIQESFQPPPSRGFAFCEVHMRSFPARNVGGDFCFLHPVDEDRLLMGLGDVAGKGVPAALTMARATAMIQARADQITGSLDNWVRVLNKRICEDLRAGNFIGITFLVSDARDNSLQICTAGQFPPLRFRGGKWEALPTNHQPPLGILPGFAYQMQVTPLNPGEFLLLFSDGISEARNSSGAELTVDSFRERLAVNLTGTKTFAAAVDTWREFVGDAVQHDDASILLLDWRGQPPPSDFGITCCPETLCSGRQFVEAWAKYCGYDDIMVGQIVVACDEAATNVFRHGYGAQPGPIRFHAEIIDDALFFEISDNAAPVDLEQIKGRDLADLRPGGLGTVILNRTFDQVHYLPQEGGNRLTLRKKLPD